MENNWDDMVKENQELREMLDNAIKNTNKAFEISDANQERSIRLLKKIKKQVEEIDALKANPQRQYIITSDKADVFQKGLERGRLEVNSLHTIAKHKAKVIASLHSRIKDLENRKNEKIAALKRQLKTEQGVSERLRESLKIARSKSVAFQEENTALFGRIELMQDSLKSFYRKL